MAFAKKIRKELVEVVGNGNVSDNPDVLEAYSRDYSLVTPSLPNYVVWPGNPQEIQEIVKLACKHGVPVIPSSSQTHFYGATIPKQGGIVLDLRKINKILSINEDDRSVKIEPGVTWKQLQFELEKRGYRSIIPLLPHSGESVLTTWLEMKYPIISFFEYGMPLQSMEIVLANGEKYTTGSASVVTFGKLGCYASGVNPQGPGAINLFKLLQGAQGTMGIVTWAMIKYEVIPVLNKSFFIPALSLNDTVEPLYAIGHSKIGYECLVLNNLNLATILAKNWPGDFNKLRETLPAWTIILIIGGLHRRPEEKIEYEEEALRDLRMSKFPSLQLLTSLPGVPRLERKLPEMLRKPWLEEKTYWKHAYKGGCQDIFFITTIDKVPSFFKRMRDVVSRYQYAISEMGCYIQPIEDSRSCHCEFNFYYNPNDPAEVEQISRLHNEAANAMLSDGALFSRPYGTWADMVYSRAAEYTTALREFKAIVDPQNIMCPGNLCF